MTDEHWGGYDLHSEIPNVARMWDFQLGGKDNFASDREAVRKLNQACANAGAPDGRAVAEENRAFIGRAVHYLATTGIDQFVDIGAGLPTQGNVHQVAQRVNPDARTVYVDYDRVVVTHGHALLADNPGTIMIRADVRDGASILDDPELTLHLDLSRPVAVLLVAVLHLLPGDPPTQIVAGIRDALAPGSYIAITHMTSDSRPEVARAVAAEFKRLNVTTPLVPRTAQEIGSFFDGLELVEPGLVYPALWPDPNHPAPGPNTEWMYAGVGRLAGGARAGAGRS